MTAKESLVAMMRDNVPSWTLGELTLSAEEAENMVSLFRAAQKAAAEYNRHVRNMSVAAAWGNAAAQEARIASAWAAMEANWRKGMRLYLKGLPTANA